MTDLEMTKLCAEAMGYSYGELGEKVVYAGPYDRWHPLRNDEQAMALVKKCHLHLWELDDGWRCAGGSKPARYGRSKNLNRAIVECVAKMQAAKAVQT